MARRIIEPVKITHRPERACPRCGGELNRIPRRTAHKVMAVVYPAKRFRCANPSCRWTGLLRSREIERDRKQIYREALEALLSDPLWLLGLAGVALLLVLCALFVLL